ncbi:hypothetical protein HDU98_002408, partial [Podochytrium sp. JEL0797]
AIKFFPAILFLSNVPLSVLAAYNFVDISQQNQNLALILGYLGNGLLSITSIFILVVDLFLLTSFIQFTRATIKDTEVEIDHRLVIISRYGIYSSIIWTLGVIDAAMYSIGMPGSFLIGLLILVIMNLTFVALFALKVALYFEDQRSQVGAQKNVPTLRMSGVSSRVTASSSARKIEISSIRNSTAKQQGLIHQ